MRAKPVMATMWLWIVACSGQRPHNPSFPLTRCDAANAIDAMRGDPKPLDHGYDDSKPKAKWTIDDLRSAAAYRGAKCHAEELHDPHAPVELECSLGHRFAMTPNLYLAGGHWCPTCQTDIESYNKVAASNPFFAQVWPSPSASTS